MDEMPEINADSIEILERALAALQADPAITDWAVPILRARRQPIPGNTFAGDSTVPGEAGAVITLASEVYGPGSGTTAAEANDTLDRAKHSTALFPLRTHADLLDAYRSAIETARWEAGA
jgi:hypothetical protein